MSNMTTDKSHPDTWYVTFGLGTPNGSTYSEILVDRETSSFCAPEEIERRVRDAVVTRYGTEWAFLYAPHEAHRAKLRATLRERIDLDGEVVEPTEPPTLGDIYNALKPLMDRGVTKESVRRVLDRQFIDSVID
jgi:hypothetical protein